MKVKTQHHNFRDAVTRRGKVMYLVWTMLNFYAYATSTWLYKPDVYKITELKKNLDLGEGLP